MNKAIVIWFLVSFISCYRQITLNSVKEEATILTTRVGAYTVLDCEIDFPQNIIIPHILQWRKDNELIFSWSEGGQTINENFANRINLLSEADAWLHGRASINVTSIRETDQGWYECKIIFPNRTPASKPNGTWFHLIVEGGNLLAIPPINETVMENDLVTLTCVSKIVPALVTWYKDNVAIFTVEDLRDRVQLSSEGSLTIGKARMKDSGYYSCEIANERGETQSAGAYLNVQFKAKIVYAPRRVYLSFGKPGYLQCYYQANPEITKIRWEKDGFLFDAYNVPGVFARSNGTLYFSKADDSHAGEYTCTPYNELGTSGPSPQMQVMVQKAPVFTVTPHALYLRKTGETVNMQCDAIDGQGEDAETDRPVITWYKKYGEISHNRSKMEGGNLTIVDIRANDSGLYECMATNKAATITSEAELLIEENATPQPPYNVTAEVTDDSIVVKWRSRYTKNKLTYSVWYRWDKSNEWKTVELANDIYEARIRDLSAGQIYEVMVLSQDENGDGIFSKTIRITTKCKESSSKPSLSSTEFELTESVAEIDRKFRSPVGLYQQIGPPTDVYVQATDDGYNVIWKPPKHGREIVKYYTVVWYREASGEKLGTVKTSASNITIKGLEEQKLYRIQIYAMSTNDYEAISQKYIYCVPKFAVKKYLFAGALIGGSIIIIIIILVRCVFRSNSGGCRQML